MGSRDNLPELPKGWVWANIEQLASSEPSSLQSGPFGSNLLHSEFQNSGILAIGIDNVLNGKFSLGKQHRISLEKYKELEKYTARSLDVLITVMATVGRCCVVPKNLETAIITKHVYRISVNQSAINPYYLMFSLLGGEEVRRQIFGQIRGQTRPGINGAILKKISIPVAPLQEQSRIVAKIEELFSELDAGVELLKKLKAKLKRYRQAVLKAAVEGKLTKDWREAHQGELEPASVLLERILKERREKWEAQQLAQMKAKGKTPKDDSWKLKYKEPVAPDTFDLPELPEGWVWASWNQLSDWITYGFTRPMPHVDEGIPIVTAKHVVNGKINTTNTHKTTKEAFLSLSQKDCPHPGDILITKDGTIGRAAVVTEEGQFCINQSVAVVWLRSCPVHRQYLLAVIESPLTQKPIWAKARGVAIQHLSITDFALISLPLPSLDEQIAIVEKIERYLSISDELEKVVNQNLKRAEKLRQSILKKAFEGKLVPQDPTDEPADKLLERIKAEKAKREAEAKAKKKQKQPEKSQQLELF